LIRRIFLRSTVVAAAIEHGCSDACDCGTEAGIADVTVPVNNGEACSVEGAKAEGLTPKCSSVVPKIRALRLFDRDVELHVSVL